MAYLWINPVTDSMYEAEILNDFLLRHGYQRFHSSTNWLEVVKEKYKETVQSSSYTVMDMRCPKTTKLLEELGLMSEVTFPEIHPILIHCGQECSEREDLAGEEKIITTPCQALADMGNALGLKNTCFIPWNRFLERLGSEPPGIAPKKSPIPLGFFKELGVNCISLSGEEAIRRFFEEDRLKGIQLVEMLYCKDGCHNGDGIK